MLEDELYDKRVLVIGDSFSYVGSEYTWLMSLKNKYNWHLKNLSVAGSGCKYAWFTFIKNVRDFDICIFSWSESFRMFHRHLPGLNPSEAKTEAQKTNRSQTPIYKAARLYYQNLMDMEFDDYTAKAMLFWLDAELEKQYPNKMFFHFHSFPAGDAYTKIESKPSDLMHLFRNGITIAPSLYKLSQQDPNKPENYAVDTREGHLSPDAHKMIYDTIVAYAAANEYKNGDIIQLLK